LDFIVGSFACAEADLTYALSYTSTNGVPTDADGSFIKLDATNKIVSWYFPQIIARNTYTITVTASLTTSADTSVQYDFTGNTFYSQGQVQFELTTSYPSCDKKQLSTLEVVSSTIDS
jgi:hypothetical protein